jgi:hypothetical protein
MSLITHIQDLAVRVATECKAHRTLINGNAADLSALTTTAKSNIVAALNEIDALANAAAVINDGVTAGGTTWSSSKIGTQITAAINGLVAGAPAALDTLKELADAINDDANFTATVTAALGNRVRVDAAQGFTAGQQLQACTNIGIGDPTTDYVATFNAGLL